MWVWSTATEHVPLEVSNVKQLQKWGVYMLRNNTLQQCHLADVSWQAVEGVFDHRVHGVGDRKGGASKTMVVMGWVNLLS